MDINSKIKWHPGMVLSSGTLNNFIDNMELRRRIAVSATLVGRFGVMAGIPLNTSGFFNKDHFEIPAFKCAAILPSGDIIDANEDVSVSIPKLEAGDHYLCVGKADSVKEFENGENTYVRKEYAYSLENLSDIAAKDVLPIVKFTVRDSTCVIDKNYILPCIQMSSDERLLGWRGSIADRLEKLLSHPNLSNDVAKSSIVDHLVHIRVVTGDNDTCSFLGTTEEIARVVECFIVKPYGNAEENEIPAMSPYDCAKWLEWLDSYLESAEKILDGTEREDKEIDVEELKREISESVTLALRDELQEKILACIRPAMDEEIDRKTSEILKEYTDGTVRTQMHDSLQEELSAGLKTSLFDVLYKQLYSALYVPEKDEEDNFMPMI